MFAILISNHPDDSQRIFRRIRLVILVIGWQKGGEREIKKKNS